ncbi:hydroxymethylglutaryl-CoA lyase, mitochondrial [Agrilus planipennis]|uniref:hydroxymethylglutaryl-CoA lyase n=1 Tax=Agrilus planipennis TaxID=224129 RepID=A0A1W4X3N6_AGRPL|nr:hydroxymethylglutaryl-CoA lyase, mitochondrial [Agrilus planipennis]
MKLEVREMNVCRIWKQKSSQILRKVDIHTTTDFVKIVEVGPRDGLQNEIVFVPTDKKIKFIDKLSQTGLCSIEVTSFVNPKWVKQMSDNKEVFSKIEKKANIDYPVLVPNAKGLYDALEVGVKEVAVFASASEGFAMKNTNGSIQQVLDRIKEVTTISRGKGIKVRAYVSCVVGCPYDGQISPKSVAKVTEQLLSFGCYEISLGDTIGVGTINSMNNMLKEVLNVTSPKKLAVHCHDTYGQGLVNIIVGLEKGINVVDSAVSGLGGCPFAKGATGNVATEDVVYMLHGMGLKTGINLEELVECGNFISNIIGRPTQSRANQALHKKKS